MGDADASVPAYFRIPLARGTHGSRHGRGCHKRLKRYARPVRRHVREVARHTCGEGGQESVRALRGCRGDIHNRGAHAERLGPPERDVATRLLGALIMTHSDDAGLVLPPLVAPVQVVVVPIPAKKNDEEGKAELENALDKLVADLKGAGLKVKVDDRDYVRNGAKYFEWERKGVPLRIELGPRDVKGGVCVFKYRVGSEGKETISLDEVAAKATAGLDSVQKFLLDSAKERLAGNINLMETDEASEYDGPGLYLVPWKCDAANEEKIKEECKATIRCYPTDVNEAGMHEGKKCFYSG